MAKAKKAKKKRDYKAEYAARVKRGLAKGLSKDIARGHPKKGNFGIRASRFLGLKPGKKPSFEQTLQISGFKDMLREGRAKYLKRIKAKVKAKDMASVVSSEEEFVQAALEAGDLMNEAYSAWYGSPK